MHDDTVQSITKCSASLPAPATITADVEVGGAMAALWTVIEVDYQCCLQNYQHLI